MFTTNKLLDGDVAVVVVVVVVVVVDVNIVTSHDVLPDRPSVVHHSFVYGQDLTKLN